MATAAAEVKYAFFGTEGAGNEQFDAPLGMAFNHDKTEIFVADSNNNRVQVLKYDKSTGYLKFVRVISDKIDFTKTYGKLNRPTGVALGIYKTKPVILVADNRNHKVCRFNDDASNRYISDIDATRPCSVALDKDGNIFVYDSSNCRIQITMTNNSTQYICGEGTGAGQLGEWGTLAFDKDDRLVVADEVNHRVQVLNSSDGAHLHTITGKGERGKQLNLPCGIAFTDDYKHIIIADAGNHRVCVLTYPDGVIVESFGTQGTGNGEFDGPYGVLVDDENGRIIVSEELNHRIHVIDNALPKKPVKVEDKILVTGKSKYPGLEDAIRNAITAFSKSEGLGAAYAAILNELNEKIDEDRKRINNPESHLSELLAKVTPKEKKEKTKGKKPTKKSEPKPVSQLKTKDEVKTFIGEKTDAIFVVTGGSFNPPHNGHIGMFQKAYDELMKVVANKGKTVYGVMVPASDSWIEGKLCKEEHKKLEKCSDAELASQKSQDAIDLKRIQVAERVTLCKLSCDSYEWTDEGKFGAENMIVVNESGDGEQFTSPANTYYLCGSDYYKKSDTKFICVLRKGDVKNDTKLTRTKGGKPETIDIKATDIIIEGGEDNDASSTMLREMLTAISKLDPGTFDTAKLPDKDKLLALISIPVLRRLLELKYILTEAEKNKTILQLMGIELDAPDAKSSNDTDSKLKGKTGVTTGGARSLANMGETCYMNAALQLIYSMTELKGSTNIPELHAYLSKMDTGVVSADRNLAEKLYARAKADGFASGRRFNQQEDSSELLISLLAKCDNKYIVQFNQIDGIFVPRDASVAEADVAACASATDVKNHTLYTSLPSDIQKRVLHIPKIADVKQTIYNLQLEDRSIHDGELVTQIFDESLQPTPHVGIPPYLYGTPTKATVNACKQFSDGSVDTQNVIIPDPKQQYLIIALMRYTRGESKIITPINLTDAEITLGTTKFGIKGCISHHGDTPKGGHYTYVEFKNGKPDMVYDDSNIVNYATYLATVDKNRTVDTEGYVLLFERETK